MSDGDNPPTNVRELNPKRAYDRAVGFTVSTGLLAGTEEPLIHGVPNFERTDAPDEDPEPEVQWADGVPIREPARRQARWKRTQLTVARATDATDDTLADADAKPWTRSSTALPTEIAGRTSAAVGRVEPPSEPVDGGEEPAGAGPGSLHVERSARRSPPRFERARQRASRPAFPHPPLGGSAEAGATRSARLIAAGALGALVLLLAGGGALIGFGLPAAHQAAVVGSKSPVSTAAASKTTATVTTTTGAAVATVKPASAGSPTSTTTVVRPKRRHRKKHRLVKKPVAAPVTSAATAVRPTATSSSSVPVRSSQPTSGSTSSGATSSYADCPGLVSPDAGCQP